MGDQLREEKLTKNTLELIEDYVPIHLVVKPEIHLVVKHNQSVGGKMKFDYVKIHDPAENDRNRNRSVLKYSRKRKCNFENKDDLTSKLKKTLEKQIKEHPEMILNEFLEKIAALDSRLASRFQIKQSLRNHEVLQRKIIDISKEKVMRMIEQIVEF